MWEPNVPGSAGGAGGWYAVQSYGQLVQNGGVTNLSLPNLQHLLLDNHGEHPLLVQLTSMSGAYTFVVDPQEQEMVDLPDVATGITITDLFIAPEMFGAAPGLGGGSTYVNPIDTGLGGYLLIAGSPGPYRLRSSYRARPAGTLLLISQQTITGTFGNAGSYTSSNIAVGTLAELDLDLSCTAGSGAGTALYARLSRLGADGNWYPVLWFQSTVVPPFTLSETVGLGAPGTTSGGGGSSYNNGVGFGDVVHVELATQASPGQTFTVTGSLKGKG